MSKAFWKNKKILVTGGKGFVGSHIVNNLFEKRDVSKQQLTITNSYKNDLRNFKNAQKAVTNKDIIIHLAADVGGVGYSRRYPASQLRNCLLIDLNIFEAAAQAKVKKLVAVSSSVGYSPNSRSPLNENNFFEGLPAANGYGYGMAKRMTVVLAQIYRKEKNLNSIVLLPNNAYGPGQDSNPETGHVIPSLIYKCLTEKKLVVWGDGTPVRDFLYVEDFAEGVLLAAEKLNNADPVNLGTGKGMRIKNLVKLIIKATNFPGKVIYDKTKPKGQVERIVDITKARRLLGFKPRWSLEKGLGKTVKWIKEQIK